MDFFKSSRTNLQAVEGYSHFDYLIYQQSDSQDPQKSQWDDEDQRCHVLSALRQRGVLVQSAVTQKKVCVFGGFAAAEEHLRELGWQESQRGRIDAANLTRPANDPKTAMQNQHVFTMFLSAIEASLSTALAASCGAIRVSTLTWLVPSDTDYQLLSVRAQPTAQGTLVLLPCVGPTALSAASARGGSSVILAPSGTPATVLPSPCRLSLDGDDGDDGADHDAPPRRARREARARLSRRAKDESWKSTATPRLHHANLRTDPPWLRVSLRPSKSAEPVSCLWPESLCLGPPAPDATRLLDQLDSMAWFDSTRPYQNPLKSAESWFLGRPERDEMEQKARQAELERERDEKEKESTAQDEEVATDQPSLASPLYPRSVQDQATVHGIYPTPPDGLPPAICTDPPAANIMALEGLPGIPEDPPLERRPSNDSDLGLDADRFRKGSTDELFGDMDEEMFGAPDVTDADFSFFDNPGGPSGMPLPAQPQALAESARDHTPKPDPNEEPSLGGRKCTPPGPESEDTRELAFPPEQEIVTADVKTEEPERPEDRPTTPPLSPLQIRERLLPSPVPAGVTQPLEARTAPRRDSDFMPVVFKSDIGNFDAKYRSNGKFNSSLPSGTSVPDASTSGRSKSIALPQRRPKPRAHKTLSIRRAATMMEFKATPRADDETSYQESDADTVQDSDSESVTSVETNTRPPTTGKRKRPFADDGASIQSNRLVESVVESDAESIVSEGIAVADPGPVLGQLLAPRDPQTRLTEHQHKFVDRPSAWKSASKPPSSGQDMNIWSIFDFSAENLIIIAQLVTEQSLRLNAQCSERDLETFTSNMFVCSAAQDAVKQLFSNSSEVDFTKLGSMVAAHADHAIAVAAKNQARPVVRRGAAGNSVFAIPPPMVRVRRAGVDWEMQPTALRFWETLGLEPANGPKDVVAFALYPESETLGEAVSDFLQDIRLAYQNCKFGSHEAGNAISDKQDGLMPFRPHGEPSPENVLQGLHSACMTFGDLLHDADLDVDKTVVIYIINPFQEASMVKYLCGCFQALWHAYRSDDGSGVTSMPDIVLQIIPINRVASPTSLLVPDNDWLSSISHQLYNRIPPKSPTDSKSAWLIDSAPSVQLASTNSRKINFTLTDRMPRNLLEEAQVLHVAYAINDDNSWLSAAWTDNTGKRQYTNSYCLSNAEGKVVLCEVRDTTLGLARNATWRVFVARVGSLRDWEKRVWREHPGENWSITLLEVDASPMLTVSTNNDNGVAGFLTPATTPQAASAFASPDAGGAPSTPVGETQEAQSDPEAFLVDTADETWGMVLPFSATRTTSLSRPLASGILLKRGTGDTDSLPSLAIDIVDVLQPKPQEGGVSWLANRAPETLLREAMVWYRGLGLIGRVRGVGGAENGNVPWHVGVASRGVEALTGFLE